VRLGCLLLLSALLKHAEGWLFTNWPMAIVLSWTSSALFSKESLTEAFWCRRLPDEGLVVITIYSDVRLCGTVADS